MQALNSFVSVHTANLACNDLRLCPRLDRRPLSKYAAGREKGIEFNRELVRHGIVSKRKLIRLVPSMPLDDERKRLILARIKVDFAAASPRGGPEPRRS
jgi:hypothetical protein